MHMEYPGIHDSSESSDDEVEDSTKFVSQQLMPFVRRRRSRSTESVGRRGSGITYWKDALYDPNADLNNNHNNKSDTSGTQSQQPEFKCFTYDDGGFYRGEVRRQ